MSVKAEDIAEFCAQFSGSDWREAHFKCDAFEIFISKDPDAAGLNEKDDAAADAVESQEASVLRAPAFGTLCLCDSVKEEPLIGVGDAVGEGDDIAAIEILGERTPVKADRPIIIVDILGEDGALVDFEAPLFRVIPLE